MQNQNSTKIWPILTGLIAAIVVCFTIYYLPINYGHDSLTLLLAAFSSIYLSTAFSEKKTSVIITELVAFIVLFSIAFVSLYFYPFILVGGYLLQAVWSYFHFAQRFGAKTGRIFPLFCMAFNGIIGLFIVIFPL